MDQEYVFDVTDSPREPADHTASSVPESSLWATPTVGAPQANPSAASSAADVGQMLREQDALRGPLNIKVVATWILVFVFVFVFWAGVATVVASAMSRP